MHEEKLWDIPQLLENYPALKPWGVRWLIRNRRIPIVRIGRRFFSIHKIYLHGLMNTK